MRHARSPRAWGWTMPSCVTVSSSRSPRVGMDRRPPRRDGTRDGDPHARGDGPQVTSKKFGTSSRSPRAWGWTVPGGPAERLAGEFPRAWGWTVAAGGAGQVAGEIPTRVGMDRLRAKARCQNARSPRAWGWTGRPPERRRGAQEIPTRVGMDRWSPRPRPTPT